MAPGKSEGKSLELQELQNKYEAYFGVRAIGSWGHDVKVLRLKLAEFEEAGSLEALKERKRKESEVEAKRKEAEAEAERRTALAERARSRPSRGKLDEKSPELQELQSRYEASFGVKAICAWGRDVNLLRKRLAEFEQAANEEALKEKKRKEAEAEAKAEAEAQQRAAEALAAAKAKPGKGKPEAKSTELQDLQNKYEAYFGVRAIGSWGSDIKVLKQKLAEFEEAGSLEALKEKKKREAEVEAEVEDLRQKYETLYGRKPIGGWSRNVAHLRRMLEDRGHVPGEGPPPAPGGCKVKYKPPEPKGKPRGKEAITEIVNILRSKYEEATGKRPIGQWSVRTDIMRQKLKEFGYDQECRRCGDVFTSRAELKEHKLECTHRPQRERGGTKTPQPEGAANRERSSSKKRKRRRTSSAASPKPAPAAPPEAPAPAAPKAAPPTRLVKRATASTTATDSEREPKRKRPPRKAASTRPGGAAKDGAPSPAPAAGKAGRATAAVGAPAATAGAGEKPAEVPAPGTPDLQLRSPPSPPAQPSANPPAAVPEGSASGPGSEAGDSSSDSGNSSDSDSESASSSASGSAAGAPGAVAPGPPPAGASPPSPPPPAGWEKIWSQEWGIWYYYHSERDESVWERPE